MLAIKDTRTVKLEGSTKEVVEPMGGLGIGEDRIMIKDEYCSDIIVSSHVEMTISFRLLVTVLSRLVVTVSSHLVVRSGLYTSS